MMKIIASVVTAALLATTLYFQTMWDAAQAETLQVWKSPTCGCCAGWVDHMKAAGFNVQVHETEDMSPVKSTNGVSQELMSCHTATIGGYVIEGHVPASDVTRLLQTKPQIKGIAVPGMPLGSPGMEVPSGEKDAYDVLAFDDQGKTEIFTSHNKETGQ